MAEYIDRKALKSEIVKRLGISERKYLLPAEKAIWDVICAVPAADVRPVVRGKWERKPDPFGFFDDIPVCSNCGNTTKWRETYLFCPYRGARMDGDADAT